MARAAGRGRRLPGRSTAKAGRRAWKGRRGDEDGEIQLLEERIRAESPAAGTGGFAAKVKGKEAAAASAAQGPALTAQLFKDLPLSGRTLKGLEASSFVKMTEIQRGAIPHALSGRDILGEARTGSGKTLAFLVPLLDCLFRNRWTRMDGLGGVVISPTRELAVQIFKVLSNVGQEHEMSAGCILGGRSLVEEQKAIANMSVLVATPGRLLQHLDESPGFNATSLLMLVIDEADRILDFGFQECMHNILEHLPKERQTLLFSATLHNSVHRLGRAALRSPEVVSVHRDATSRTPVKLKQIYMTVGLEKKIDTLFSFLRSHSQKKIIVFVSTCKQVRFLYEAFRRLKPGPAMMELHGRQSLTKRMIVFEQFMEKDRAVALVCTDIAARGVDFPAVDWVVQVDCPDSVDSYIHRVGRTARYQSTGRSAILVLPSEKKFIEKLAAAKISVQGINPKQSKVLTVSQQLASLLAGEGDIRHLATRAYASYMRSVKLMRDKDVFDAKALPRESFAQSLGLADAPELGSGWEAEGDEDPDENNLKKQKNQSALQRLKDKIKEKKRQKAAGQTVEEDDDEEMETGAKKKLGRWERRQRRIAAAAGRVPGSTAGAEEAITPNLEEAGEEELLQLVAPGQEAGSALALEAEAKASLARKKGRLKIRRDGSAAGVDSKHTFFVGGDGTKAGSELAQLAEELDTQTQGSSADAAHDRAGFLKQVAKDLATRDSSDAAVSRARIYERHQKKRRKDKDTRGLRDEDDDAVEEMEEAASDSPPPSPRVSPPPKAKGARAAPEKTSAPSAKRQRTERAGSQEPPKPAVEQRPASNLAGGLGDDLGDLEREALSRLSGGLFG